MEFIHISKNLELIPAPIWKNNYYEFDVHGS